MRYLYLLLFFSCLIVEAQRGKKSKSDLSEMVVTEMSESDSLKAEITLIEAEKQLILENYTKAYELFKVAGELNPGNAAINFKLAEVLTKLGNNTEALPYALQAVDLSPDNKYYYLLTAEIHKALSNFERAAATYETMIARIEGSETYLFDLAIIYRYIGKNTKALETYDKVEEFFGPNELIFREKRQIYLGDQNYDAIATEWDKLIEAFPDNTDYKMQSVEFLLQQNRVDEAKARLTSFGHSDTEKAASNLLLTRIALQEGRMEEALSLAEQPLISSTLDSNTKLQLVNDLLSRSLSSSDKNRVGELCLNLAEQYPEDYTVTAFTGDIMFRLEQKKKARDFYLKAINLEPGKFEVWQNILNIDAELNEYDSLINHSEQALEYFPNQALLYYFAGTGYLVEKNYRRSVQLLEQGRKFAIDPMLLSVMFGQLGDAYNAMKKYSESNKSYDQALENNNRNDHVLNNYSYFLSLRGEDLEKAYEMSRFLVELHPDNPTYLDTYGWVLYQMKEYTEAKSVLERASGLGNDGTVTEHYGDVLFQLGQVEEAVAQWEKARRLGDASKQIDKKIEGRRLYE